MPMWYLAYPSHTNSVCRSDWRCWLVPSGAHGVLGRIWPLPQAHLNLLRYSGTLIDSIHSRVEPRLSQPEPLRGLQGDFRGTSGYFHQPPSHEGLCGPLRRLRGYKRNKPRFGRGLLSEGYLKRGLRNLHLEQVFTLEELHRPQPKHFQPTPVGCLNQGLLRVLGAAINLSLRTGSCLD
jgi:hypothetical protein